MLTKSIPAAGIKEAQSTVLRSLYGWLHEGRTHATELAAPYESTEMLRRFPVVPDWLIREELRGSGVDAEATLRTLAAKGLARECDAGEIMAAWREAPWIFMECGFCIDSITQKPIGPGPVWRLPDGRSIRVTGRVSNAKLPGDRMYEATWETDGVAGGRHSSSGGLPGCWYVLTPAGIVAAEDALEPLAVGAKIPTNGEPSLSLDEANQTVRFNGKVARFGGDATFKAFKAIVNAAGNRVDVSELMGRDGRTVIQDIKRVLIRDDLPEVVAMIQNQKGMGYYIDVSAAQ